MNRAPTLPPTEAPGRLPTDEEPEPDQVALVQRIRASFVAELRSLGGTGRGYQATRIRAYIACCDDLLARMLALRAETREEEQEENQCDHPCETFLSGWPCRCGMPESEP